MDGSRWHKLIDELYYPAVLGAGFFAILGRLFLIGTQLIGDVAFWFAVVLVMYFSLSYLLTSELGSASYSKSIFLFDLFEIVLISVAFSALGFADLSETREVNLPRFYFAFGGIPLVEWGWQWRAKRRQRLLLWPGLCALLLLTAGFFLGQDHPYVNEGVVVLLAVIVIWYFIATRGGRATGGAG